MRLRRFAGLVAALTMAHVVLVTGEVECALGSGASGVSPAQEMTSQDGCEHASTSHADAPLTPPRTPEHHTHDHGALCCTVLAGCAAVFAAAERAAVVGDPVRSTRITPADSDGIAPPRIPPDPPPPKS